MKENPSITVIVTESGNMKPSTGQKKPFFWPHR